MHIRIANLSAYFNASRTAQSDAEEIDVFVTSRFLISFSCLTCLHSPFFFFFVVIWWESRDPPCTNISKSSVMILNTEDLPTPHKDATSLNVIPLSVVMMSWTLDFMLSLHTCSRGLPHPWASFRKQIPSEKRLCHFYTNTNDIDTVQYFSAPSIFFWGGGVSIGVFLSWI